MTYSSELFKLPQLWRNTIKKLEGVKVKFIKAKWSLIFNDICLKENPVRATTSSGITTRKDLGPIRKIQE